MLRVSQVSKSFNSQLVLNRVSFELEAGELCGLVGPSGSGKSVLLKILGAVMEPDSGSVSMPVQSGEKARIGFLFQEGALFDSMTVLENVAFPLLSAERYSKEESEWCSFDEASERAYECLCQVGLGAAYQKIPGQLSGGMRRRVGIARALVHRPELVLMDDPTGGLDPVAASAIMSLISELHELYKPTVVLVSHDIRRLLPRVSRVLALFQGQLVSDTATSNLEREAPEAVLQFLKTRFDFNNLETRA